MFSKWREIITNFHGIPLMSNIFLNCVFKKRKFAQSQWETGQALEEGIHWGLQNGQITSGSGDELSLAQLGIHHIYTCILCQVATVGARTLSWLHQNLNLCICSYVLFHSFFFHSCNFSCTKVEAYSIVDSRLQ